LEFRHLEREVCEQYPAIQLFYRLEILRHRYVRRFPKADREKTDGMKADLSALEGGLSPLEYQMERYRTR
jgi:hypothetical protein